MRAFATGALAALLLAGGAACTGRQVEVGTGPAAASTEAAPVLRVTNSLGQAVNVYVVTGGAEMFVGQVGAQATQQLTVRGVASGAAVALRARQVDGRNVFERDNVVLTGVYEWRVP